MSIQSSLLGGAGALDATRTAPDARPLALQHEDPSSPDFNALLNAAADRERHGAELERSRRGDRARAAGVRTSERSAERAERARSERGAASDRADALRYDMLKERQAETHQARDVAERVREPRDADRASDGRPVEAAESPRSNDAADRGDRVDQSNAAGSTAAPEAAAQAAPPVVDPAADALAAAALAAAAADPTRVVRDPNTLAPELRERLDRVVARMRDEFGHDVQIVEAARTPQRQDYLFEQGRTRPGAVVTWTHNSKHLDGRAADLTIDGGWRDAAAFDRLQQVAAEEGLRTLGARDPGHVELAGAAAGRAMDAARGQSALAALQRMATVEQISVAQTGDSIARVAEVAQVAQVAQVAEVARVGAAEPAAPAMSPAAVQMAGARGDAGAHADGERDGRRARAVETPARRKEARAAESTELAAGGRPSLGERGAQVMAAEAPAPVVPVDAASRISRVLELQDAANVARPMSHMTLRLDNAAGGEDRIRVDLRGLGVGTNIDVTDAGAADRMQSRVSELQRALEGHGLESEGVRIGVRRPEAADAARGAAAAIAAAPELLRPSDAGASSSSHQQPSTGSQRHTPQDERRQPAREGEEPGQHAGESSHRSRKEPHGDRKR